MAAAGTLDVAVLGGGPSGLVCAWEARRGGRDVVVLESGARPGGNVWTVREETEHGTWLLERGPNSFGDAAAPLVELVADLGLADRLVRAGDAGGRRLIYARGRLHAVPAHPLRFLLASLLPPAGRLRLLREPFVPPLPADRTGENEETLAEFCDRRLGRAARDLLLTPVVGGIYAGDPERLGAESAFPRMVALERRHGSLVRAARKGDGPPRRGRIAAFDDGLSVLTGALAADLAGALHTRRAATGLERTGDVYTIATSDGPLRARNVVLACPARAASRLVERVVPEAAELLAQVESPPLAVVHVGVPRSGFELPAAFGFLVPRDQGLRILGCLFSSALFPGRAPAGHDLLTVFVGGALDPAGPSLHDAALATTVQDDLRRALPGLPDPVLLRIHRWERAIPQATRGHGARMARAVRALRDAGGLHLCTNVVGGIALPDCVANARALGRRLAGREETT